MARFLWGATEITSLLRSVLELAVAGCGRTTHEVVTTSRPSLTVSTCSFDDSRNLLSR